MRAEVKGSVCSPKDCPATLEVEPSGLEVQASGAPNASLSPTVLDLPTLHVGDIKARIVPPEITLQATKHFGGVLGALFATGDNLIDSFLDVFTNEDDFTDVVRLDFGTAKVEIDAFDVEFGKASLHGAPVTDTVRPTELKLDLDETEVRALFRGLTARLLGCIAVNGGECGCDEAQPKPPVGVLAPVITQVESGKVYEPIVVHGQNFGSAPGRLIVTSGAAVLATEIGEWTQTLIKAVVTDLESGSYAVQVQTAENLFSNSVAFEIP